MSAVPYTFANNYGNIPLSQLDANFANCKAFADTSGYVTANAQANITSVGLLTSLSVAGNTLSANISATTISATGTITGGNLVTTGNISITGAINTTGNITGGNILTSGVVSVAGRITGGNISTGGSATVTGTITGGNILTAGIISSTGNVTCGNVITTEVFTDDIGAGGNIYIAGDFLSGGFMSVTGAITGGNILTNGNVLAGALISTVGNVEAGGEIVTSQGVISSGFISAVGDINAGNVYSVSRSSRYLDIIVPVYANVTTTGTYNLSTTSTINILLVNNTGYTATLNMPTSPVEGQICNFAVSGNTVTLAVGTGTVLPTFAGSATAGTSYQYVYRTSNTSWYRIG